MTNKNSFYPRITSAESGFIFLLLATLSGALCPILYDFTGGNVTGYEDSNPYRFLLLLSLYSISLTLSLYRYGASKRAILSSPILFMTFLLPLMSTIWSVDPLTTLKRALAYALTGVCCFYFCSTLSFQDLIRRLVLLFFFGAVMSVIYSLAVPSYGVHHGPPIDGAWKGVYGHKNELGRACTFGIIIASLYRPDNIRMNSVRWATIFLSLMLVYLSQSKTNWLAIGAWLGFLPVLWFLRLQKIPKSIRLVTVVLPTMLIFFLVSQYSELLLESVGRDSTMSGRTTLWRGVAAVTNEKFPLLGAGYGAFFTDNGGLAAIGDYIRYWSIRPNHAHNGYLNVFADLGWAGEIALITLMVGAIYRVFYFLTEGKQSAEWTTAASFILMFLITNYSQSLSFKHSDLTWLMFCIVYLYAAMDAKQYRGYTVRGVPLISNHRTALLS